MNVLILNTSPKKKGGASRCFSRILKSMLWGCKVKVYDVCNQSHYAKGLELLEEADAVVISSPLYVDGIPAHMLPFLQQAEDLCKKKKYNFKLYVLSNNGFVEGIQNKLHLKMYEAWCQHAGVEWGGGLGIGGGVLISVVMIVLPITIIMGGFGLVKLMIETGAITMQDIWEIYKGSLIILFLLMGFFVCEFIMAYNIRKGNKGQNLYTRPLMPSFIFLIVSDIFMILSAMTKGKLPHKLFKQVTLEEAHTCMLGDNAEKSR